MKKEIKSFILALSLVSIPSVVMASSSNDAGSKTGWLSLWLNEDEEDEIQKTPSRRDDFYERERASKSQNQRNKRYTDEDTVQGSETNYYNMGGYSEQAIEQMYVPMPAMQSQSQTQIHKSKRTYNTTTNTVSNAGDSYNYAYNYDNAPRDNVVYDSNNNINGATYQSPLYFVPSENNNSYNIDYDTYQSERSSNNQEMVNSIDKWRNGGTNVFWENYRGNNIRIEMLRNNRDLKEMRLKFVQSQSMTSDPDGSISDILNVVADRVMKRTCGKKSKQSVILYERPSVELERETAADGYKIMAKGTSLKEYGFRCIY